MLSSSFRELGAAVGEWQNRLVLSTGAVKTASYFDFLSRTIEEMVGWGLKVLTQGVYRNRSVILLSRAKTRCSRAHEMKVEEKEGYRSTSNSGHCVFYHKTDIGTRGARGGGRYIKPGHGPSAAFVRSSSGITSRNENFQLRA